MVCDGRRLLLRAGAPGCCPACVAERFGDQRAAGRSLWCDAWRRASDLTCRKRCRQGGGRTDGQLRCGSQLGGAGGPSFEPHAPLKAGSARSPTAARRSADADTCSAFWSLARPGAITMTGCGPAHGVGAGLFGCSRGWVRSWALVCSRSGTSAIPARFRLACRSSAIRRSRSRLCWLYQRVPPLVPAGQSSPRRSDRRRVCGTGRPA